jgi:ferredoxin-NADP reductase
MSNSKEYFLPFLKKEPKSQDAYSFYFDKKDQQLNFLPGQYIRMSLPHLNPDNRGTGRFFTISSSPLETDYIVITTRILQSTFKQTLNNLRIGEKVKIFGPMGNFYLDETDPTPKVFLAGGIGITPYHSILKYAAAKNMQTPLTLFVSFSTTQEMVFFEELTHIAQEHTNIKVIYTITQPENSQSKWEGETGRISGELIKKYITNPFDQKYYIVGPTGIVESMHKLLQEELKLPEEKIITENFPGYLV